MIFYKNMSIHKWNRILKDFDKGKVKLSKDRKQPDSYGECGFCKKYEDNEDNCPLNGTYCACWEKHNNTYWEIVDRLKKGDYSKETRSLIVKMLNRVKEG
jgi:hypothetical protein